jgi:Ni,Fe-hydrogenase III large subunit
LSLEIERVAMHLADLGGLAGDIGLVGIAANFARFRGRVLGLAELLAGSRFQKAFLRPGGLRTEPSDKNLITIKNSIPSLEKQIFPVLEMFMLNQDVCQRMQNVGRVSNRLAKDFAFVGVAGRASGIKYDARSHFVGGLDQQFAPSYASHKNGGDVYSRAKIRVLEIKESLRMIAQILDNMPAAENVPKLPQTLPANQVGVAIVESHRGELIHLVFTDESGLIKRYAIKDPSLNNWTALAIAVRNNLVADFPLCNKSFSLSYSGHDL